MNDVIWFIVFVFFFVCGFVCTGLGDRVATMFVRAFGKFTFGLFYGLIIFEVLFVFVMLFMMVCVGGVYLFIIMFFVK